MARMTILKVQFVVFTLALFATFLQAEKSLWGKSNGVITDGRLGDKQGRGLSRARRSVSAFTSQQQDDIVEEHNAMRRQTGGADLKVMVSILFNGLDLGNEFVFKRLSCILLSGHLLWEYFLPYWKFSVKLD